MFFLINTIDDARRRQSLDMFLINFIIIASIWKNREYKNNTRLKKKLKQRMQSQSATFAFLLQKD